MPRCKTKMKQGGSRCSRPFGVGFQSPLDKRGDSIPSGLSIILLRKFSICCRSSYAKASDNTLPDSSVKQWIKSDVPEANLLPTLGSREYPTVTHPNLNRSVGCHVFSSRLCLTILEVTGTQSPAPKTIPTKKTTKAKPKSFFISLTSCAPIISFK